MILLNSDHKDTRFNAWVDQALEGDVAGLRKKFCDGRGDETGVDPEAIDFIMI